MSSQTVDVSSQADLLEYLQASYYNSLLNVARESFMIRSSIDASVKNLTGLSQAINFPPRLGIHFPLSRNREHSQLFAEHLFSPWAMVLFIPI